MKLQKAFKLIAIISYLLIILMGQMIGMPFAFWLLANLFYFGNIDQLFAVLATIALVMIFKNRNKEKTAKLMLLDVLCFVLLCLPIAARLTEVPIELFNYPAFIAPTWLFVICYVISLGLSARQILYYRKTQARQHKAPAPT